MFHGVGNKRTCSVECAELQAKATKRKYNAAHPNRSRPGYKPPSKRGMPNDVSERRMVKLVEEWMLLPAEERWKAKGRWPKQLAPKMDAIAKKMYASRNGLFQYRAVR